MSFKKKSSQCSLHIILAVYLLTLFITLIGFIFYKSRISELDTTVAIFMYDLRNPFFLFFFFVVTWMGKSYSVIFLSIACIILMYRTGSFKTFIIPLIVVITGAGSSVFALKLFFHRVRPSGLLSAYVENTFSFPSGHSAIAIAFYGFLTYILLRQCKNQVTRMLILFAGFLIIVLVGFSRIYLGVHYLSDVLAGYVLGSGWMIIGIMIAESRKK